MFSNRLCRSLPAGLVVLIAFSATAAHAADDGCQTGNTEGDAVDAIRKLENVGAQTNVNGQSLADAERFFADDFITVNARGETVTRDEVLAGYEDGRLEPWARRFDLTDLKITAYCESATVIGVAEAWAIGMPDVAPPIRFKFLHVWTLRDGEWLYTAQQFTRLGAQTNNDS